MSADLESQHSHQSSFKDYVQQMDPHNIEDTTKVPKPDLSWPSIKHYTKTRFTQLLPSKAMIQANKHMMHPLPGLRMIGGKQWLMIFSAFMAWA